MDRFKNLELIKFPKFDEPDEELVITIFDRFFNKSFFGQDCKLSLTLKDYSKGGLRKQHEIHAKFVCGDKSFYASDIEWNLIKCIQKVIKKLESEVKKQSK
jgi:hypothetical protein